MSILKRIIYSVICVSFCVIEGCGAKPDVLEISDTCVVQTAETWMETDGDTKKDTEKIEETKGTETVSEDEIYVYVCGCVKEPGVLILPADSRWFQAVERAGGPLEGADLSQVNMAAELEDGERIYIPAVGEKVESLENGGGDDGGSEDAKVDLNQASREELMTLPGIGASKADAILQYRETQGGFQSVEDLMKIPGIKEGVYSKIEDRICVR